MHIKGTGDEHTVIQGVIVNTQSWENEFNDLKCESLVEVRLEGFPVNFGFKLFLFVWEQIEFHVRVGATSHVHCRQFRSLDDAYYQLE